MLYIFAEEMYTHISQLFLIGIVNNASIDTLGYIGIRIYR